MKQRWFRLLWRTLNWLEACCWAAATVAAVEAGWYVPAAVTAVTLVTSLIEYAKRERL